MAESKHWQIAEAIKTRLAAIAGNGGAAYWYTPNRAVRVINVTPQLADPSIGMTYAIRAGEDRHEEESTGGGVKAFAEFWILMMRPTEAADDNPFGEDSNTKVTEQDRMVQDFLRAMWSDVTLGGLAQNIAAESLDINWSMDADLWALVEARFTVQYSYLSGAP